MKTALLYCVTLLALAMTSANAAPTLLVNSGGLLTGANGVTVNGALYDVAFIRGGIASIFPGGMPPNPPFSTGQDGVDASQALLDQVFVDGSAGQFDSNPWLTSGCETASSSCFVVTPFEIQEPGGITGVGIVAGFLQNSCGSCLSADYVNAQAYSEFGYTYPDAMVYAVWNQRSSGQVPEPSTVALIAAAALGLSFSRAMRR